MAPTPSKKAPVAAPAMVVTTAASPAPALTRIYAWFSALVANDIELLRDLHMHGVPIDALHPLRHTTALMEAARLGRTATVQWLLERGAAPAFLCGMPVGTSLHCALRRKHWEIARILIEAMENIAVIDAYGCTPLHVMAMEQPAAETLSQQIMLAILMIEKGCPLDALDHEGITALHHCVINDAQSLAETLLRHGAASDALIPDTWVSPLTIAALEKNQPLAELLLRYGASATLKTREGTFPLAIWPQLEHLQPA